MRALRHPRFAAASGSLVLAAFVALGFAADGASATGSAKRNACERWGTAPPAKLKTQQARRAIVCLLNQRRRAAGLPLLSRNRQLEKAAQRHSEAMDGTGCFEHRCPGEPGLDARLEGVDYLLGGLLRWAFGENIAWGEHSHGTPSVIVDAWMGSSGHRANILSRSFREVGVGFSRGTPAAGASGGGIYTTDFGLRID